MCFIQSGHKGSLTLLNSVSAFPDRGNYELVSSSYSSIKLSSIRKYFSTFAVELKFSL